ncbi:MAG: HAMP domain-containing histidine kinase [Rhodothermales bacterium]|nr:HAMP domain-containing histidine kinase [Rhodothermales bacterium]
MILRDLAFSGTPLDPESRTTGYDQRDLTARIDILSSVNRGQIEGQSRLISESAGLFGRSESVSDWRWLSGAELSLGNLAPGSYELQVRARKYRGDWSETRTASFTVAAPFWQQWWFIALLAVGAFVLIRGFLAWKLRRVRLKNAVLQQHIRQLEEADRAKNEFLSNMSHEIRTPIAAILGFAAILREELRDAHIEFVDHITAGAQRLQRTLDSVLDLAQLSNDQLKIDLSPVDVGAEAAAAVTAMRHSAEKKGLTVRCFDESAGAHAYSHGAHLARVLDILIFNAIKFTDEGGVTVAVSATESMVHVKVSDTGIGIEPSFLPRLFEPFRQASTGAARTHEGNGLGLSITKRVIELMGGSVDVQSKPGEGSTFTVTLRRHANERELDARRAPVRAPDRSTRPPHPVPPKTGTSKTD